VFVALALALAGAGVFAFLRSGTADDAPAVEADARPSVPPRHWARS
jgi:hypothetical protein